MQIDSRPNAATPHLGRRGRPSSLAPTLGLLAPPAVILIALALRTVALDRFPPGLYHDEAYYGLDAVGVLHGNLHVYFPANNGREPLFIYLVSLAIAVLGPTAFALRLTAAYVGTLTVAATYALGAQLFGRRAGLAASAWMAVTLWPVWLSRTGFRAGTLPCVLALAVAATAYAARRSPHEGFSSPAGGSRSLVLAGFLAGLTMYTYTAARILPVLGTSLAAALFVGRRLRPSLVRPWLAAALVTLIPLAIHFARAPADILGRAEQVAVGSGAGGSVAAGLAAALWHNVLAVIGMVLVRGDTIPRHNVPGWPVFWLASAPALLAGLAVLVTGMRGRRASSHLWVLLWLLFMALPTILAEDAPHYLRAAGLLPAIMVLPALTMVLARSWSRAVWRWCATGVVIVGIGGELARTLGLLTGGVESGSRSGSPATADLRYAFEDAASLLAAEVRRAVDAGEHVWLDRRLRDGWASVPYLAPMDKVTLADRYDPVLKSVPGVAFLMPEKLDLDGVWSQLPTDLRLEFTPGPLARGDLDAEASTLYVRVEGRPAEHVDSPVARWADGLALIDAVVVEGRSRAGFEAHVVTLTWQATAPLTDDLTVFVKPLQAGGRELDAVDQPLGGPLFGTHRWQAGIQVREVYEIPIVGPPQTPPACFLVGLYHWPDLRRIPVVGDDGQARGDHVAIRGEKAILNDLSCP